MICLILEPCGWQASFCPNNIPVFYDTMRERTNCEYHARSRHELQNIFLTDARYLVDYTYMTFTDPNGRFPYPIDRDSPFVDGFNIWRDDEEFEEYYQNQLNFNY